MAVALIACSLHAQSSIDQANKLYQSTQYTQAISLLKPDQSKDPAALLLAGKSFFMLGDFKRSVDILHKATALQPASSETWHWLGKAYGRRAETSSFITAPKYAVDCRAAFEKAVELDPKNVEAMEDLMEYYMEAPGFLGGGLDKASNMARRIVAIDPSQKHVVEAKLAEKRKDFAAAEQHLRAAVDADPQDLGRLVELAKFLSRHGKHAESDSTFDKAIKIAPASAFVIFSRAQAYVEGKRNHAQARELLRRYLTLNLSPDDPSREEAQNLLNKLPKA